MSRRKVQIIREYETNNNDSPQETTITQTSSKSSGGRISSEKPLKPMKIDIVRDNRSNNEVVPAQQPPASFGDMQAKMEAEMETRRLDWEKEVIPENIFPYLKHMHLHMLLQLKPVMAYRLELESSIQNGFHVGNS